MNKFTVGKLYVWYPSLKKYLGLPGLTPCPVTHLRFIDPASGVECPHFTIPFFNKHFSNTI